MTDRLNPAVSGDSNDNRTIRLLGVDSIPVDATITAEVWRTDADDTAITATRASATTVTLDLGTWLATNPAADDWSLEVTVNGTTWPASGAAVLPVRDDAP